MPGGESDRIGCERSATVHGDVLPTGALFNFFDLKPLFHALPPDPSVHNVAVQEGEREGQKAVLLESLIKCVEVTKDEILKGDVKFWQFGRQASVGHGDTEPLSFLLIIYL
jgi:hypothetical protein